MVDKEKQKIKKAREAAGEDVDDISPKVRTLLSTTSTQTLLTFTAETQDG
jgi:hypothetical protein